MTGSSDVSMVTVVDNTLFNYRTRSFVLCPVAKETRMLSSVYKTIKRFHGVDHLFTDAECKQEALDAQALVSARAWGRHG